LGALAPVASTSLTWRMTATPCPVVCAAFFQQSTSATLVFFGRHTESWGLNLLAHVRNWRFLHHVFV
jgi:hypothetical protein